VKPRSFWASVAVALGFHPEVDTGLPAIILAWTGVTAVIYFVHNLATA
jgi:hypothetical protein